jgi:hypothetical protein
MILIKQHNSHQAAHLYEHMFCMAVDDFFYDNKLFPYLDYHYIAKTVRGTIYFSIYLHTEESKKLEGEIRDLKIYNEDKDLHIAIIQLGSELKHNLGHTSERDSTDWSAVQEELSTIEKKPWQNTADVDVIDPQATRLVHGSLYIPQDKTAIPVRKVNVAFTLDKDFADDHKELLPLYNEISELMSENTCAELYGMFGFYSVAITRSPKNKVIKLTHSFHVADVYPLKLPLVRDTIEDSIIDLDEDKAFQRLIARLHVADHSTPDEALMGVNYVFKQTGLIVGAKGWQRIATDENCEKILAHMKVTVSTGHSRLSMNVNSVLYPICNRP